jgi:hypothetical protein
MQSHSSQLLLYAKEANTLPHDLTQLTQLLYNIGLLDKPFLWQDKSLYTVGFNFLQLIHFLGCSPSIETTPSEKTSFCFVQFGDILPHIQFIQGLKHILPRCPHCRKNIHREEPIQFDALWQCSQCNKKTKVQQLNWRQSAGFSRFFITINNVFQYEAVPSDRLMNTLEQYSHCTWDYFYLST